MRNTLFVTVVITLTHFASSAMAFDDGFGDRFYNQGHAALGDYQSESEFIPEVAMDDLAQDLQDIMPAAGEDTTSQEEGDVSDE